MSLHISALQRQACLVTWLITLLLIICPSSYKARPDNLIGLVRFGSVIIFPQRSDARPNFPTKNVVGEAKFVWHPGYRLTTTRSWIFHDSLANFGVSSLLQWCLSLSLKTYEVIRSVHGQCARAVCTQAGRKVSDRQVHVVLITGPQTPPFFCQTTLLMIIRTWRGFQQLILKVFQKQITNPTFNH